MYLDFQMGVAPAIVGRYKTRDEAPRFNPFATQDAKDARGVVFDRPYKVTDAGGNVRTVDSSGAFLVGELERLDQTLHMPLAAVTYPRDMELREDVTIADEVSSYTGS